jgi:hypothetical protein
MFRLPSRAIPVLLLASLLNGVLNDTAPGALVGPGDLAFVGFNADSLDDFAIVLLAEATAGQSVYFNDNEWTGAAFNGMGEGEFRWDITTSLAAGTVVTFSSTSAGLTVSHGTVAGEPNLTMSLGADGETIFAYLGTDVNTPTAFLGAISTLPTDVDGSGLEVLPATLTLGTNALLLPPTGTDEVDGGAYNGARTGQASFSGYLSLINNSANWLTDVSDGSQYVPFSNTQFTIESVPEPRPLSATLLMLMVFVAPLGRRRQGTPATA